MKKRASYLFKVQISCGPKGGKACHHRNNKLIIFQKMFSIVVMKCVFFRFRHFHQKKVTLRNKKKSRRKFAHVGPDVGPYHFIRSALARLSSFPQCVSFLLLFCYSSLFFSPGPVGIVWLRAFAGGPCGISIWGVGHGLWWSDWSWVLLCGIWGLRDYWGRVCKKTK